MEILDFKEDNRNAKCEMVSAESSGQFTNSTETKLPVKNNSVV